MPDRFIRCIRLSGKHACVAAGMLRRSDRTITARRVQHQILHRCAACKSDAPCIPQSGQGRTAWESLLNKTFVLCQLNIRVSSHVRGTIRKSGCRNAIGPKGGFPAHGSQLPIEERSQQSYRIKYGGALRYLHCMAVQIRGDSGPFYFPDSACIRSAAR